MKTYDREKRKWVGKDEKHMNKKDPNLCKGKRPHDFILVLPEFVEYDSTYNFKAEEYYRIVDEKFRLIEALKDELKAIGVRQRWGWNMRERRLWICSVCQKRDYREAGDIIGKPLERVG